MAKLPPIDLREFLALLKSEGWTELSAACASKFRGMTLMREWDNIIIALDEIVVELAKGAEIKKIIGPANKLAKSAASLSLFASQVLSFVPGPVGIVCSLINAIVCFCTMPFPINIGNGFLELLGCIPGGKVAGKLAPKFEKILMRTLEKSPELRIKIQEAEEIAKKVKDFSEKVSKKVQDSKINKNTGKIDVGEVTKPKTVGGKLNIDEATYYSGKGPSSILFEGDKHIQHYRITPGPETKTGNPYANIYSHLWK
jgi:hypothetical protein